MKLGSGVTCFTRQLRRVCHHKTLSGPIRHFLRRLSCKGSPKHRTICPGTPRPNLRCTVGRAPMKASCRHSSKHTYLHRRDVDVSRCHGRDAQAPHDMAGEPPTRRNNGHTHPISDSAHASVSSAAWIAPNTLPNTRAYVARDAEACWSCATTSFAVREADPVQALQPAHRAATGSTALLLRQQDCRGRCRFAFVLPLPRSGSANPLRSLGNRDG